MRIRCFATARGASMCPNITAMRTEQVSQNLLAYWVHLHADDQLQLVSQHFWYPKRLINTCRYTYTHTCTQRPVDVVLSPCLCASRTTSSHSRVLSLSGHRISRTCIHTYIHTYILGMLVLTTPSWPPQQMTGCGSYPSPLQTLNDNSAAGTGCVVCV